MTLTGPDVRILQVHPTRFCNLRCVHCYSSSGPLERETLSVGRLREAVRDAARIGYNVLSVSGGEPLLYPDLPALCREARNQGMIVTLVTNGTILTRKRISNLEGLVDAIAISLDGAPERHNRIRRSPRAFESMAERLPLLRQWGIPFGFVFTLTDENLPELEWAADFAVSEGAGMVQVHPIEANGRALADPGLAALTDREMGTAWIVVECLREIHAQKLAIQFDALNRFALPFTVGEIANWKIRLDRGLCRLSEIVSPLVIEDDGSVVPLRYGFPRSLGFGNLLIESLSAMAPRWAHTRSGAFCDLFREVLDGIAASGDRFANIYQLLAEHAGAHGSELIPIHKIETEIAAAAFDNPCATVS